MGAGSWPLPNPRFRMIPRFSSTRSARECAIPLPRCSRSRVEPPRGPATAPRNPPGAPVSTADNGPWSHRAGAEPISVRSATDPANGREEARATRSQMSDSGGVRSAPGG